jgi:hypothetical protein
LAVRDNVLLRLENVRHTVQISLHASSGYEERWGGLNINTHQLLPLSPPFFTHKGKKMCLKFAANVAPRAKKFNAAPAALPSSYYKKDIVLKMSKS